MSDGDNGLKRLISQAEVVANELFFKVMMEPVMINHLRRDVLVKKEVMSGTQMK